MSEKPKVLLISYIYPPAGGGGSPRLVRWTRALLEGGYEPIVITVKPIFTRGEDQSLLDQVKGLARIERTSSLDPKRLFYLLRSFLKIFPSDSALKSPSAKGGFRVLGWGWRIFQALRDWFAIPDEIIGWIPFAFLRALRLIRQEKPLLIITSSSPHSVQLVGLGLKKFFSIPWLADFRDAWLFRLPARFYPSWFHQWVNTRLGAIVVKNADAVTFAYGFNNACELYPAYKHKFHLIHNGYNEKDFQEAQRISLSGFNLLYLGAFYRMQTPRYFFSALKLLLAKKPELANELRVWLIGMFNPEHIELLKEFGLEKVVQLKSFIPHQEVAGWLLSADVLLLFLGSEVKEAMVIPGKVFEYIRAPGWILAMIPEGETAEILRAAGGSIIVPDDEPNKIQEALEELYQFWKQGKKPVRNLEYVRSKEETQLKLEMSKIVSSLISRQPNPKTREEPPSVT